MRTTDWAIAAALLAYLHPAIGAPLGYPPPPGPYGEVAAPPPENAAAPGGEEAAKQAPPAAAPEEHAAAKDTPPVQDEVPIPAGPPPAPPSTGRTATEQLPPPPAPRFRPWDQAGYPAPPASAVPGHGRYPGQAYDGYPQGYPPAPASVHPYQGAGYYGGHPYQGGGYGRNPGAGTYGYRDNYPYTGDYAPYSAYPAETAPPVPSYALPLSPFGGEPDYQRRYDTPYIPDYAPRPRDDWNYPPAAEPRWQPDRFRY
ncbi:MAG TPA: hypothetical protein ENI96_06925 [Sedimenticola thiotaurini]|uniref:Uncharacterized protein n=1 Tax=Sedimenticola thiotaurini TaxID=1543721 RepID=A0A831RNG8_9GAMM|nr:hypothetical protein [Sedimenticola thiotaurini]